MSDLKVRPPVPLLEELRQGLNLKSGGKPPHSKKGKPQKPV